MELPSSSPANSETPSRNSQSKVRPASNQMQRFARANSQSFHQENHMRRPVTFFIIKPNRPCPTPDIINPRDNLASLLFGATVSRTIFGVYTQPIVRYFLVPLCSLCSILGITFAFFDFTQNYSWLAAAQILLFPYYALWNAKILNALVRSFDFWLALFFHLLSCFCFVFMFSNSPVRILAIVIYLIGAFWTNICVDARPFLKKIAHRHVALMTYITQVIAYTCIFTSFYSGFLENVQNLDYNPVGEVHINVVQAGFSAVQVSALLSFRASFYLLMADPGDNVLIYVRQRIVYIPKQVTETLPFSSKVGHSQQPNSIELPSITTFASGIS